MLCQPAGVAVSSDGIFVSDTGFNRILHFSGTSTTPDRVYGQPDFTSSLPSTSTAGLNTPIGIAVAGDGSFYVADSKNNRVLHFPAWHSGDPTAGIAADLVYNPSNPTSAPACNSDVAGPDRLCLPTGVTLASDGSLYVADFGYNRVLHFPTGSTTADSVYGQVNFSAHGCNTGGVSASALCHPFSVSVMHDGIAVSDTSNNRVLHFPAGSTTADQVFGQFDMSMSGTSPVWNADMLYLPQGIAADSAGGLYIADYGFRVLHFAPPVAKTVQLQLRLIDDVNLPSIRGIDGTLVVRNLTNTPIPVGTAITFAATGVAFNPTDVQSLNTLIGPAKWSTITHTTAKAQLTAAIAPNATVRLILHMNTGNKTWPNGKMATLRATLFLPAQRIMPQYTSNIVTTHLDGSYGFTGTQGMSQSLTATVFRLRGSSLASITGHMFAAREPVRIIVAVGTSTIPVADATADSKGTVSATLGTLQTGHYTVLAVGLWSGVAGTLNISIP